MNKDNKLMMEALQSKFTGRGPVNDIVVSELHKMHTALNQMATMIDLNPSAEVDQLLSKIRDVADMLIADAPAENAENEPHGYPQGMTAIQNTLINVLKKHGFKLNRISHADKDRDAYPTVFMMRSQGAMHNVVEIDGMGAINGEHYEKYVADLKDEAELDELHGRGEAQHYAHKEEDAEHRSHAQNAAIAISLQKAGKKPS